VGTYNVSLNAGNAQGSSISTRNAYVVVSAVSTGSSSSGSSSSSSSRLSIIASQTQDAAISTDNSSEELSEESAQTEETAPFTSEEEQPDEPVTEDSDVEDTKSTPDFGALAAIVLISLAMLVLRKINN
jgi:PKD repeat protein